MIMAVMAREIWTDERLDDLSRKVDEGFARIDADIRELRLDISSMRKENQQEFLKSRGEVKSEVGALRGETKSEGLALRGEIKSEGLALRGEIKSEVGALRAEMNARFDTMNRNFLAGLIAVIAAIIGSNATLVAVTLF
jgi:hypothetical protein